MRKILFMIIPLFVFWGIFQYWPVKVQIENLSSQEKHWIRMPLKDKRRLEFFFREFCFLEAWAYTLYGSKPMSFHSYTKPWNAFLNGLANHDLRKSILDSALSMNFKELWYHLNPLEWKMKLGWETLNRYVDRIPNSRFALLSNSGNQGVGIVLVDKVKLIEIVKYYQSDFQGILDQINATPEQLQNKYVLHQFLIQTRGDGLLGTLLGFGRDNAWLFEKYRGTDLSERPMTSAWPQEELENLEQLNQRTFAFQPWELSDIFYPRFACDPNSEETIHLKQVYREEREKIIQYYTGKDIVEATLSLFFDILPFLKEGDSYGLKPRLE